MPPRGREAQPALAGAGDVRARVAVPARDRRRVDVLAAVPASCCPALAISSVLLLARAAPGCPRACPRALGDLRLIGFACAGSFALITPIFQAPGRERALRRGAVHRRDRQRGRSRAGRRSRTYSTEEVLALEAVHHGATIENAGGAPAVARGATSAPTAQRVERRRTARCATTAAASPRPRPRTRRCTTRSPRPPTSRPRGGSVATELTATRLISCLFGALVALFAFLTVRELLPRHARGPRCSPGCSSPSSRCSASSPARSTTTTASTLAAAAIAYLLIRGAAARADLAARRSRSARCSRVAPLLKGTGYFLYPGRRAGAARHARARARPAHAARARRRARAPASPCTVAWALIAPVFGRTLVTAPAGNNADRGRARVQRPGRLPLLRLAAVLPAAAGHDEHLRASASRSCTIYVVRGWGAFGWYAILFPALDD